MTTGTGTTHDLAVIGAGMAGMAAALGAQRGGASVAVLEARGEPGGVARSERRGEWLLEAGPNSMMSRPATAVTLAKELGLEGAMQASPLSGHARFLWGGRRLVPVPMGPGSLIATPLLSLGAKLRLATEPFRGGMIARHTDDPAHDQSLGAYMRSHLGNEFVDTFLVPMVSGIYAADPDGVSLEGCFPKLARRVQGRRSLVLGAILGPTPKPAPDPAAAPATKGPRTPRQLITFDDGLQSLPRAVGAELVKRGAACHYGCQGILLQRAGNNCWIVRSTGPGGEPIEIAARQVLVATAAWSAADVLAEALPAAAAELRGIPTNAMTVAHLGVPVGDLPSEPKGFGFLVPRRRGLRILGGLFSSSMFARRAPSGHVLLTCFLGGELDPEGAELSDDDVLATLRTDLGKALGWNGREPALFQTTRWKPCLPVYRQGHPQRIARLRAALPPGVHLAGNYLDAISLPDTIDRAYRQGGDLARG